MSVKIKVSYEHPKELQKVLKRFENDEKRVKISRHQDGKYKRAYIELTEKKPEKT